MMTWGVDSRDKVMHIKISELLGAGLLVEQ